MNATGQAKVNLKTGEITVEITLEAGVYDDVFVAELHEYLQDAKQKLTAEYAAKRNAQ